MKPQPMTKFQEALDGLRDAGTHIRGNIIREPLRYVAEFKKASGKGDAKIVAASRHLLLLLRTVDALGEHLTGRFNAESPDDVREYLSQSFASIAQYEKQRIHVEKDDTLGILQLLSPAASQILKQFDDAVCVVREKLVAILDGGEVGDKNVDVPFKHSKDYRSVLIKGHYFELTGVQAHVVRILHEHYQNGTPSVGEATVLEIVDSQGNRIKECFQGKKADEARKALIRSGERKGTIRLNLD